MYRMVVPLPLVERGQKASPLGVRSHALGRKLSAKQTDEVPLRWLRAFIVAEARGVAFGEDLIRLAAPRQSTFPIGGRLRNALRPASIRVVFKVDDITLWGRYQSQTEPSLATLYRGRGAGRSVWGGPHPSCRFAAIHLPHRGKA